MQLVASARSSLIQIHHNHMDRGQPIMRCRTGRCLFCRNLMAKQDLSELGFKEAGGSTGGSMSQQQQQQQPQHQQGKS